MIEKAKSEELCQFFTTGSCSAALVAEIDSKSPGLVADVGAGHGSLAIAAIRRWGGARLALFDRDPLALEVLKHVCPGADRFQADLLFDHLPRNAMKWIDRADVVLCNPPFRAVPSDIADRWFMAAGMPLDWPLRMKIRAELVFLAHNLRLLKQGGEMAMILPAAFINGHEFVPFRSWLLDRLTVTKVIQLPPAAFSRADVRAYAIIVRKSAPPHGHRIRLVDLSRPSNVTHTLAITPRDGVARLDLAFHALSNLTDATITLGDMGATILRGVPVSELKKFGVPYFHTTDFAPHAPGTGLECPPIHPQTSLPMAMAGDVLLGRIGRSCHKQLLHVASGMIPYSDCVYRIEVPEVVRTDVLASLADPRGIEWRQARLRGSTVNLLSKMDLLRHPIWTGHGEVR